MKKITRKKAVTKGKIRSELTGKNLTANAGLLPVLRFMDKLLVGEMLGKQVTTRSRGANAEVSFSGAIERIIVSQIAGATAMEHVSKISSDDVICKIAGWEAKPVATTLSRVLGIASNRNVKEFESVMPRFRGKVWKKAVKSGKKLICAINKMIIDLDSTVQGVFGDQEGAEIGYNPKKKGQKSYHPMMAFCSETKEILHSWYRCGSAYTSNGTIEFLKELFASISKSIRKILRADSGFFDGNVLDYLESESSGYLIKVKLKGLYQILNRQTWTKTHGGWEESSFEHKCGTWSKKRKFVAVRKLVRIEEGLFPTPVYEYFCYVTTEKGTPMEIHRMYGKRATCETWIEECKSQMKAGYIRSNDFTMNSILFQCGVLAYNILKWMTLLAGGDLHKWEVKSIRMWLIRIAGKLVTGSRQLILKLPEQFIYHDEWKIFELMTINLEF